MPYKSVSAPRSVLDLGAEVKDAVSLASPAIVAVLTTDPVRLAVHPAGGGTGKVSDVALTGADDLAFLSRDVAVVRSGDDVWALLDVTHTARPDQVARDAKALLHRPAGETALVLGWDGSATALTVGKNEVVARQFALRGEVRACDLGDAETYVVVDGGAGELRVHPGATPEPGPSIRAALPAGAQRLDRLRGGRELCAVFTPGNAAVCVVRRTAGSAVARMVVLDAAPLDVATSETSLLACRADGTVALYDGAALASAGDAPLAPTSTLRLGARGEPRALTLSGRGSPSLWVGTAAGELVQVALARKPPT